MVEVVFRQDGEILGTLDLDESAWALSAYGTTESVFRTGWLSAEDAPTGMRTWLWIERPATPEKP